MIKFPDFTWLPNMHPLVVHLPIGIILAATALMFITLVLKKNMLFRSTLYLLLTGVGTLAVAYISGKLAVETVIIPANANPVLGHHSDFAFGLLVYYLVLSILIIVYLRKRNQARLIIYQAALTILAVFGTAGLGMTADYGGQLVYRYGVGIKPGTESNAGEIENHVEFRMEESGSWSWNPQQNASDAIRRNFTWFDGTPDSVNIEVKSNGSVLISSSAPYLVTTGIPVGDIQVDMEVLLDDYQGELKLIHHLSDEQNYDFLQLSEGTMALGRQVNNKTLVLDRVQVEFSGTVKVRVVGSGNHFRGYLNDSLKVHGHKSALPPGIAGFAAQGSGKLEISSLKVQALKP